MSWHNRCIIKILCMMAKMFAKDNPELQKEIQDFCNHVVHAKADEIKQ